MPQMHTASARDPPRLRAQQPHSDALFLQIRRCRRFSSAMHLYALTLQRPTCITCAVAGNFSGTKQQEILVGRGSVVELLRPDPNTGKVRVSCGGEAVMSRGLSLTCVALREFLNKLVFRRFIRFCRTTSLG